MNFRRLQTFEGHRMHELTAILVLLRENECSEFIYVHILQRLNRTFTLPKPDLVSPEEKIELLKLRRQTFVEEDKAVAVKFWDAEFQNLLYRKEKVIILKDEAIIKNIRAIRTAIDDALRKPVGVQSFNPEINR